MCSNFVRGKSQQKFVFERMIRERLEFIREALRLMCAGERRFKFELSSEVITEIGNPPPPPK